MSQPPGWPRPEDIQGPPQPYGPDPRYGAGTPPGQYQPPQQYPPQSQYPPSAYPPQSQYPQSPAYPQSPYAPQTYQPPPPAPPRKRHTGLKITLGVLGALIILCGVGGFLVIRPFVGEYPATLSAPDSVAGMQKITDPQFQQLGDTMTTELKTQTQATSAIGAFYAKGDDKTHAVMVAGVTKLILNPGTQMHEAFTGMSAGGQMSIDNVGDVDPGSMGGTAECGSAKVSDISMGVCAWADHGALGMIVAYNHTQAETADLMRTIRPQVQHRG